MRTSLPVCTASTAAFASPSLPPPWITAVSANTLHTEPFSPLGGGEGIVPRSTPCGDRAWLPPHHSSGVRVAPRVVGLGGGTGLEPLLLPVDGAQMP